MNKIPGGEETSEKTNLLRCQDCYAKGSEAITLKRICGVNVWKSVSTLQIISLMIQHELPL